MELCFLIWNPRDKKENPSDIHFIAQENTKMSNRKIKEKSLKTARIIRKSIYDQWMQIKKVKKKTIAILNL